MEGNGNQIIRANPIRIGSLRTRTHRSRTLRLRSSSKLRSSWEMAGFTFRLQPIFGQCRYVCRRWNANFLDKTNDGFNKNGLLVQVQASRPTTFLRAMCIGDLGGPGYQILRRVKNGFNEYHRPLTLERPRDAASASWQPTMLHVPSIRGDTHSLAWTATSD